MSNLFALTPTSIKAIMIRDVMARYGRNNIGFLWALIEPILLAVGVMTLWSFIRAPFEHGIPLMAMVFTGYLPLTLWRHVSTGGASLFLRSGHYLYHRRISLMDIFVARVLSEFSFTTAGAILIYSTLRLFDLIAPVERWDLVIAGWLIMCALAGSFLLLMGCLIARFEDLEKFTNATQYLLLPLSGCFFMMDWLPETARSIMWFMPLVHPYEMIREGAFGNSVETHFAAYYPLLWSASFLLIAINMMPRVRQELHGQ